MDKCRTRTISKERGLKDQQWTRRGLFKDIYWHEGFIKSLDNTSYLVKTIYEHWHCDIGRMYLIDQRGHCVQCDKFIATIEKLNVMVGLKELNGNL